MDRLRSLLRFKEEEAAYEPLNVDPVSEEPGDGEQDHHERPFSWLEYAIFAVIGVAMLWAWNMFLAAAPYFQFRFQDDQWVEKNFQSAILTVSTVANLGSMGILTRLQQSASYSFRINLALYINALVFALLAIATQVFLDASPGRFLVFLLFMVGLAAWAAGLIQNGAFAFASSFGRPEYMQAIMAGQGVAGVLPALVQVGTVMTAPSRPGGHTLEADADVENAAFAYFLTAVVLSVVAILAFIPLVRRHDRIVESRLAERLAESLTSIEEAERAGRKVIGAKTLFRKLHWFCGAVFMCFVITMFFPVFTPKILSVRPPGEAPRFLQPDVFIPLGFLFWNIGDLGGRAGSLVLPFRGRPVWLFVLSMLRILFLPLYALCNINGLGAVIPSDVFYLFLVQLPFGLTNGWLASTCMMGAGEWVNDAEREASGGFMGLCLVAGLAFGSLLSFTAAGI